MSQSSTLFIGMDVHNDSLAGAYVAQEHGTAVMSLVPKRDAHHPGLASP
jgi:hypothetical protein